MDKSRHLFSLLLLVVFILSRCDPTSGQLSTASKPLNNNYLTATIIDDYTIIATKACEFISVYRTGVENKTSNPQATACSAAFAGVNHGMNRVIVQYVVTAPSSKFLYVSFNSTSGSIIWSWITGTGGGQVVATHLIATGVNRFWLWGSSGNGALFDKDTGAKVSIPAALAVPASPSIFSCGIFAVNILVGVPDNVKGTTSFWFLTNVGGTSVNAPPSGAFGSCSLTSSNSSSTYLVTMPMATVGFGLTFQANYASSTLTFVNQYFILPDVNQLVSNGIESQTVPNVRFWVSKSGNVFRDNFDQNIQQMAISGLGNILPNAPMAFFADRNVLRILYDNSGTLTAADVTVQKCSTFSSGSCTNCLNMDPYFCRWEEFDGSCVDSSNPITSTQYNRISYCPSMGTLNATVGPAAGGIPVQFPVISTVLNNTNFPSIVSKLSCMWQFTTGNIPTIVSPLRFNGGALNVTCLTPNAPVDGEVRTKLVYKSTNVTYVTNDQVYNFGKCDLAGTSYDCADYAANKGFRTCGWCNRDAICSRSQDCSMLSTWNQTIVSNITSLSSYEFLVNTTYTIQIYGRNFQNNALYAYSLAGFEDGTDPAGSFPDYHTLDSWKSRNYTVFKAAYWKPNVLNVTITTPSSPSTFSVAVYQNNSLMAQNMVGNIPSSFSVTTINCSLYENCSVCPLSVCGWCGGVCTSNLNRSPCITQSNGTCDDTVPNVSFEGENCDNLEGENLIHCNLSVVLWYAPSKSNYSISFTGNYSDAMMLTRLNTTSQGKRDALTAGSTNKFVAVSPFSDTVSSGSYSPVIYQDGTPFEYAPSFQVYQCQDKSTCSSCIEQTNVCKYCDGQCFSDLSGNCSAPVSVCESTTDASIGASDSFFNPSIQSSQGSLNNQVTEKPLVWPIIVGAVIGGIVLIVIVVIIVILILRRNPNNYSEVTIPLPPPPDFDTVTLSKDANAVANVNKEMLARLNKMEEVLLADGFPMIPFLWRLPEGADLDNFSKYFVYMALNRSNETAARLLLSFAALEIENTKQETTLFRLNSVATAMFTAYSKVIGLKYLWEALAAPIWEIVQVAANQNNGQDSIALGNLELDSDKIGEGEVEFLESNIYQVLMVLSKVFALIRKSVPHMSNSLRKVVAEIGGLSRAKFPQAERKAVGSFVFLRYVVPAIVSPHYYSILEEQPGQHAQRMLIIVSRVMQNLANETLPSKKSPDMEKLDQFVIDNTPRLFKMYENITNANELEEDKKINLPGDCHLNSLVYVHNILVKNRNKLSDPMCQELVQYLAPMEIPLKK